MPVLVFTQQNYTTGEGGMAVFKKFEIASLIKNHGISSYFTIVIAGSNYRMTTTTIGLAQLNKLMSFINQKTFDYYNKVKYFWIYKFLQK